METDTAEHGHAIETAVLFCAGSRRVEGKELLSLDLETILNTAQEAAKLLCVPYRLVRDPNYGVISREHVTEEHGSEETSKGGSQGIHATVAELRKRLESALAQSSTLAGDARIISERSSAACKHKQPEATQNINVEFVDEMDELSRSVVELLELSEKPLDLSAVQPLEDRAYQKLAIAACCDELAKTGKAILQMACRCGKTRVGYGIMEKMAGDPNSAVLFLVPSLPLLRQTAQKLLAYGDLFAIENVLLVGSDPTSVTLGRAKRQDVWMTTSPGRIIDFLQRTERRLVVSTYQSSPLLPESAHFALIIFDEAHRICGGQAPRPFNSVLLSSIQGKRLFMTATPAFDPAEISMKNKERFGGVAYRYYLRQGIDGGYVNDFQLKLVAAADKGSVCDEVLATQIAAAAAEVTKLLVFSRDINHAERLRQFVSEKKGPVDFECLSAHSRMPPSEIAAVLRRFCEPERRMVVFTCRLLQEGVEIPQLNAIFFASPRHSFRDIIQSICRPLNKLPDKPLSTVYLPVNVDPGVDFVDPANLQRYATLVEVFDAIAEEDRSLFDYLLDAGGKAFPISCLGTKSLGLTTLEEKQKLLAAIKRAVRYGTNGKSKLTERLLKTEAIPWELGFGELKRIVMECRRFVKTTDGFKWGSALINFYRVYDRYRTEYLLWKEGKPTQLEPYQIQALASLPMWEPLGTEGPYPWKPCMDWLERWLEDHGGHPPPVEVHHGGYIGLNATWMERLSGALTCSNQADGRLTNEDGKRRVAEGKSAYLLPPEKQADLKRIGERFGLCWHKERDEKGELVENGPKTFIQTAYDEFKRIYELNGPRDPYISKWYPGYPHKHSVQEDPSVPRSVLPPRYRVEKKKVLKSLGMEPIAKEKKSSSKRRSAKQTTE
jgi:superfamily II DNA or RNA helicase